ncbi:carbamoyltransferase HypF [Heliophilum fasciatum]|uniref:Carbamoyltransferase n=1 Tax=Heliophilum fasciatum TaxID=35700 RepID=A0A4R2RE76_9FIRM|nr:carbamoyltransferase HypF [Heliophilum fasciatum]MCW2278948.1 hydrogenase maturation protein HypF [Heliophilum fasciatum]TCP61800.1 hydrogenase maturation protein HypF [Heliophilum fasciatum]
MKTARRVMVKGVVQGVGFRPFVYRLAAELRLGGWVANTARGVEAVVEGDVAAVEAFLRLLVDEAPALSRISEVQAEHVPLQGWSSFQIRTSKPSADVAASIPPDMAMCPACRQEMNDPEARRYRYPLTNCTNCGPRYSIVERVPYDRPFTSMRSFALCPDCRREYDDPGDRRFHAQPLACPVCGPQVWLTGADGMLLGGDGTLLQSDALTSDDCISMGDDAPAGGDVSNGPALIDAPVMAGDAQQDSARSESWAPLLIRRLQAGAIAAIKGVGGFHLACDGRSSEAIARLRQRKHRPAKALAVMARDLEAVRKVCKLSVAEEVLLLSPVAPIVILERLPDANLPANLAPGTKTLGVMLPYSPLHEVLFATAAEQAPDLDLLVMTSGNRAGLPLCYGNEAALAELGDIADLFLQHNRAIVNPIDDSVVRVIDGQLTFYRRARGYVPAAIPVPVPPGVDAVKEPAIIAVGGEWKNTFALLGRGEAVLSPHIGTVETREGRAHFLSTYQRLQELLALTPVTVAVDRHPGYQVSALGRDLHLPVVEVQHHHAHLAAVLAEHGYTGEVIGAILDGTGYGEDGVIRGFELLRGSVRGFERLAWLEPVPLPGGDSAVGRPWLVLAAHLGAALGEQGWAVAKELFPQFARHLAGAQAMIQAGLNAPLVSSAGRLFDAVAALLGLCLENTYDGQAAVELGESVAMRLGLNGGLEGHDWARAAAMGTYPVAFAQRQWQVAPLWSAMLQERDRGEVPEVMAQRFHNTIAHMVVTQVMQAGRAAGIQTAVLSGGVWQNPYLTVMVRRQLLAQGWQVLLPRLLPANDGGLALGQAVVALWQRQGAGRTSAEPVGKR